MLNLFSVQEYRSCLKQRNRYGDSQESLVLKIIKFTYQIVLDLLNFCNIILFLMYLMI